MTLPEGAGKRIIALVGSEDPLTKPEDVKKWCAENGVECREVPGHPHLIPVGDDWTRAINDAAKR